MDTKNTTTNHLPETLIEAVRQFSDLDYATEFFAKLRWPEGARCPHCGSDQVDYIAGRRIWQCRSQHARSQFSVKIGTVFEECRLPIDKCLIAFWLEINAKNSISSYEIARTLGVTQKTAWFLLHRIRYALHVGSWDSKLSGVVEADETFIGGRAINMHKEKRAQKVKKTGVSHMTPVMGLLARHDGKKHSTVRAHVVDNLRLETMHPIIQKNVEPGSKVFTDALMVYRNLGPQFFHDFVDHAEAYVKNKVVHTNGLENFWALFKRCIKGTHVSVEPAHLAAYVDSEAFRFNNRETNDGGRFVQGLPGTVGKRLTYKALIGALGVAPASGSDAANANPFN
jgi:transposase-like protein